MNAADDERARRGEARRWLAGADEDLAAVDACLAAEPPLPKPAAYHCRQAIEKLIKGLLVLAGVSFRKTHNLRELTLQAAPLYPGLEAAMRELMWLTVWGFAYRYPMEEVEDRPPTAADVRRVLGRMRGCGKPSPSGSTFPERHAQVGHAAQGGAAGPDSDYDLPVVLDDDAPEEKLSWRAAWEARRDFHPDARGGATVRRPVRRPGA